MRTEQWEFIIPEWAVCPIVNGDYSALSLFPNDGEEEVAKIEAFVEDVLASAAQADPFNYSHGHFSFDNEEHYFHWKNDIMGNIGDTVVDCVFVAFYEED